jgi:hypothetical protein
MVLSEEESMLWRWALPRAGWWRKAQRDRLPTRLLTQSHTTGEESRKRQAWLWQRQGQRTAACFPHHRTYKLLFQTPFLARGHTP